MQAPADAAQLAYAAPRMRRWWRRRRVWLAVLLLLVMATLAGYRFGRAYWWPYWQQAVYLYWQDRSMRWTAPPEFVVYEEDDARAPALLRQPDYEPVASLGQPERKGLAGPPAGHVPAPMRRIGSWVCMCFIHGCYTPSGEKRLGVVGYQVHGAAGRRYIEIYGSGKTLATLKPGTRLDGGSPYKLKIDLGATDRLRLFAGQPDPNDKSRFTMLYELNGQSGNIEGRLADDGIFRMNVLDGPAAGARSRQE